MKIDCLICMFFSPVFFYFYFFYLCSFIIAYFLSLFLLLSIVPLSIIDMNALKKFHIDKSAILSQIRNAIDTNNSIL